VQGLIAAGRDPARVRRGGSRSPLAYLRSLVESNGAVRYSRTSAQTPVWVTAQALTALAGKALPLSPAPRRRRDAATAGEPASRRRRAGVARAPAAAGESRSRGAASRKRRAAAASPPLGAEEPTAQRASLVAPAPSVTPLVLFAAAMPAATPDRARNVGLVAAVIARTWLPRG
jgi:hypothetical protein